MSIYARQYGGLGNRLFQRAAAIGYAMKYSVYYTEQPLKKGYALHRETSHSYSEIPVYLGRNDYPADVVLDGYFQSEKYFAHCREEVLSQFGFKWEPKPGWCSIHVRRGDYLKYPDKHPVVTMEYIKQAIEHIEIVWSITKSDKPRFMVFSDDLPWCRENFKDLPYQFLYSCGRTDIEDLIEGSCCEHNIISNSTFSWWQSWLGRNENKIVITPHEDNWFGINNKHLDVSDLLPSKWIRIKY